MASFSNISVPWISLSIAGMLLLIMVIACLMVRLSRAEKRRREADGRFHELERKVHTLELENLESKLNPHLFKNILNSPPCYSRRPPWGT